MKTQEDVSVYMDLDFVKLTIEDKKKIRYIKKTVSEFLEVDESEFYNKSKRREIVTMKQVSSFFMRRYVKNISYKIIGKQFNNLNYATILYGVRKVYDLIDSDKKFKAQIEKMNVEINEYISVLNGTNPSNEMIDLNDIDMMDISKEKKVIFVGFSDMELSNYKHYFNAKEISKFDNTGLYLYKPLKC